MSRVATGAGIAVGGRARGGAKVINNVHTSKCTILQNMQVRLIQYVHVCRWEGIWNVQLATAHFPEMDQYYR